MLRRSFISLLTGGALSAWAGFLPKSGSTAASLRFDHGVASGDPLADRVVLWTRVSGAAAPLTVGWEVATDSDMQDVIARGRARTDASRDYTVKVDARRLPPASNLWYRFRTGDAVSPVGRTKTLPTGRLEAAAFAVASCSNHASGYFHAYRDIASRDDVDAVLHLGDYLYEHGPGGYATEHAERLGRIPDPPHEAITLEDYRRRHAQYKQDPDSIAMHGRHPLIAVWDDHELQNDAWRGGATSHPGGANGWAARRDAAIRAYFEWMPVRGEYRGARSRIFRSFRFGDLATLVMLDTRLYGRDRQADAVAEATPESIRATLADPGRTLLGGEQERWLERELRTADGTWQLIGQQVMVTPARSPDLEPLLDRDRPSMSTPEALERYIAQSKGNPPMLLDTWNGYPAARERFLAALERHARNPVVLSGDLHAALAGELTPAGGERPVAVEFVTTSVSAPGFSEYLPEREPGALASATLAVNPMLRYMRTDRRGWLRIALTKETLAGEWHFIDDVRSKTFTSTIGKRLAVRAGAIDRGFTDAAAAMTGPARG